LPEQNKEITKPEQSKEVTEPESKPHRGGGRRSSDIPTFPRDSFKKSLRIAEAIERDNAGKLYDRLSLAKSINLSPNSSSFRQLITSSSKYGLTKGGYQAGKLELTSLGRSIVAPTSDEERKNGLRNALLTPEVFKSVLEFYDTKQVPREELLKNSLKREFRIIPEDVDTCYRVIMQNIEDYGLSEDIKGNAYLKLNNLGAEIEQASQSDQESLTDKLQDFEQPPEPTPQPEVKQIPKVFISHSKNENILEQIKDMLDFGNFEYIIAEEEETSAIPIPDKVFGLMRECNCAIINVSADEENKQEDGSYRINENVLIEIGGAFVHYNKRVILLVDKRIILPSNLQGLYRCEYEGDELLWNVAMRLQKVLAEFRKSL